MRISIFHIADCTPPEPFGDVARSTSLRWGYFNEPEHTDEHERTDTFRGCGRLAEYRPTTNSSDFDAFEIHAQQIAINPIPAGPLLPILQDWKAEIIDMTSYDDSTILK